MNTHVSAMTLLVAAAGAATASAQVEVILQEGMMIDGSAVSIVGAPTVDAEGNEGLLFGLADGRRGIWRSGAVDFIDDQALPTALSGGETTIAVANGGKWVYSPSIDGADGLWSDQGFVIVENTQAPGFAPGVNTTFHSRPTMADDGTIFWASGYNDGAGGTSTQGDIIYRRDGATGTFSTMLTTGETYDGTLVSDAINFDFAVSYDGNHSIFEYDDDNQSSSSNGTILVDYNVVAQEGSATGQGDNWDNFDYKSMNNSGNYLFSGDTDGSSSSDEFIAYNGAIALREDDTVDGVTLGSSVRGVAINNANQAAFVWTDDASSSIEHLFFASDASALAAAGVLLSTGDMIDTDGDGNLDAVVTDFNAFTNGDISLRNDGWVYLDVDLDDLAGNDLGEAAIRVRVPAPAGVTALAAAGLLGLRRRRR